MRCIKYLFVLLVCCSSLSAQPLFRRVYGGLGVEKAVAVTQFSDSSYMLLGQSSSWGGQQADVWLQKIAVDGKPIWSKFIGEEFDESIAENFSHQGNQVFVGSTNSFGNGYDFYIVCYDEAGQVLWKKHYGGSNWDVCHDGISVGGVIYLVGETYSSGQGNNDLLLMALDVNGNFLWEKTFGTVGFEKGVSLCATNDNHLVVLMDEKLGNDHYTSVYKINSLDQSVIWTKQITDVRANEVIQLSTGDFVICGQVDVINNKTDMYVLCLDGNGVQKWDAMLGGAEEEGAFRLMETLQGEIAVLGYTSSFGEGEKDIHVYTVNSGGWFVNGVGTGGWQDDFPADFILNLKDEFVILGTTYSFGQGESDFYFVKSDEVCLLDVTQFGNVITDILDDKNEVISQHIYPSITSEYLFIGEEINGGSFTIYAASGKKVMEGKLNKRLDVSQLQNGIYFINSQIEDKLMSFKFIIN